MLGVAVKTAGDALYIACEMEKRAVKLYERAALIWPDGSIAAAIGDMLSQEREHLRRLQQPPGMPLAAMGGQGGQGVQIQRGQGSLAGLIHLAGQQRRHGGRHAVLQGKQRIAALPYKVKKSVQKPILIAKARAKHGFCRGPVARIGQSDGQEARHLFCAFFRVARCCPSSWAMARKADCASG